MGDARLRLLGIGFGVAILFGTVLYMSRPAPVTPLVAIAGRGGIKGGPVEARQIAGPVISTEQLKALEAQFAIGPENPNLVRNLAFGYGRALVSDAETAAVAQAALDQSNNVWVLGNAAYWLQSEYNRELEMGVRDDRLPELAERYFARALQFDPNLSREQILPQIDLEEIAARQEAERIAAEAREARRKEAVNEIPRLRPEEIPGLPAGVVASLNARGCRVPQTPITPYRPGPSNAIRGEFYAPGEESWAVFCSDGATTDLLVFENPTDSEPDRIWSQDDLNATGIGRNGDEAYFGRQIVAVDRDYITRHWDAYGQGTPPVDLAALDHQGIDDWIGEKASTTWYFDRGEWIPFPGAD